MVLSRPHLEWTVCELVAYCEAPFERLQGTDTVLKLDRSFRYFVSRGVGSRKNREERCLWLDAQR